MQATNKILSWFKSKSWNAFDFQKTAWQAYMDGKSGLIHAPTGFGKTYAAWFGPLIEYLTNHPQKSVKNKKRNSTEALTILWVTPLRALANDTHKTLAETAAFFNLNWSIEARSGDTSSTIRSRQSKRLPTVLITTPESLALLLSYPDCEQKFKTLKMLVVDEWHELLSTKRGVLTELNISRLRSLSSDLRTWGLSATLGNTETAMQVLLGKNFQNGQLIRGLQPKEITVRSVLPENIERFPWAGHLGIRLLEKVINIIEESESCLVFTNTRSQTEIWYQEILQQKPQWAGWIALHHGSLDKQKRTSVEKLLAQGKLKCVVCTSSMDLGVDFAPVDRVIQIGSPKGIARIMQRAGRSGHQPGKVSTIYCVPTNAFELLEISAVREAIKNRKIEARQPISNASDVLIQHIINTAIGPGFKSNELFKEVKSTWSFRDLTKKEWQWILQFAASGGDILKSYPEFSRIEKKGSYFNISDKNIVRRQRMSIGTITADSMLNVRFMKGNNIGNIEENFISRLKPGDSFFFAGRNLEYITIKDMTVFVRLSKNGSGPIPQWMGGRMPLSTQLADEVRNQLQNIINNNYNPELELLKPIFTLQNHWSAIPEKSQLLVELLHSRDGTHIFIYPFAGYLVHEGLGALLAYRIAKTEPLTFSITVNDYGLELFSDKFFNPSAEFFRNILHTKNLIEDILDGLNFSEMEKRQFREIARIAGLVFQGYPGSNKSAKQLQASSHLFYEVFKKYDPGNLLLQQARRELLEGQLEHSRLRETMQKCRQQKIVLKHVKHPTPFAFPLLVTRLRSKVSTEKLSERVKRMQMRLEKLAG